MSHFSWQSAVLGSDCTSTVKLVLLVIGTHMNQHGAGAFPSYARIAQHASLSRRATVAAVQEAERAGWLKLTRRERDNGSCSSNEYEVSFPANGSAPDALGVVNVVHQGGELGAPHITPHLTPQLNTVGAQASSGDDRQRVPVWEIISAYNDELRAHLPAAQRVTDMRVKHIRARWREMIGTSDAAGKVRFTDKDTGIEWFRRFFRKVTTNPHWLGGNERGWTADLDWIINSNNFTKILEYVPHDARKP